jgi:hypothetical protein
MLEHDKLVSHAGPPGLGTEEEQGGVARCEPKGQEDEY